MIEEQAQKKLTELLRADGKRFAILQAVAELALPDCLVAAGFLRNLAWDHVHGYISADSPGTALNDVDIIYFDPVYRLSATPVETAKEQEFVLREALAGQFPDIDWDVKNQARMHLRNHHSPYSNTSDAMTFWPEKETAVGVKLVQQSRFDFVAPFGLSRLFKDCISYNNKRDKSLFDARVTQKNWQHTWPQLKVIYDE